VVLADWDAEGLEEARERLAQAGCDVRSEVVDIADPDAVDALFARVDEALGGVDVTFANAGVNRGANLRDPAGALDAFGLEDWETVLSINLTGAFSTIRASARIMKRQRAGSIVVTASTASLRAEPKVGYAYVASKAALVNLVRQASIELAAYSVRINAIAPGPVETNIAKGRALPPDYLEGWLATIPLGRRAKVDELKGIALLLASPASSYVTGSVWTVDGGASALTQGRMQDVAPRTGSES
jgi:NAD(P)-dependent dehydrogenase (short-subunit alcohol dehydrogenase family)